MVSFAPETKDMPWVPQGLSSAQCIRLLLDRELGEFRQRMLEQLALLENEDEDAAPEGAKGKMPSGAKQSVSCSLAYKCKSQLDQPTGDANRTPKWQDLQETEMPTLPADDESVAGSVKNSPRQCRPSIYSSASQISQQSLQDAETRRKEARKSRLQHLVGMAPKAHSDPKSSIRGSLFSIFETEEQIGIQGNRTSRLLQFAEESQVDYPSESENALLPDMLEGSLEHGNAVVANNVSTGGRKSLRVKGGRLHSGTLDRTAESELREFSDTHPFRGRIRGFVLHWSFSVIFNLTVVLSAILMGAETEAAAMQQKQDINTFLAIQTVCCFLFVIELLMRLVAFDIGFFGCGKGHFVKAWKWNLFDLICTVTMIADLSLAQLLDGDSILSQVSLLRSLRLIRAIRAVRVLEYLESLAFASALRRMMSALQYAVGTLLWAFFLLVFIMYFFALAFTQATTDSRVAAGYEAGNLSKLTEQYGSLSRSYFSLFMAITGGMDWGELTTPLSTHTPWLNTALFVMFIAITVFGVLNVIMSVFVESALESVQHYKELLIESSNQRKEASIAHLKQVFSYIDADGSGDITADEMAMFLSDTYLTQYLDSVDIHVDDFHKLFQLLDYNQNGLIDIDEFCEGCLKMKGEAKSYDIQCLLYENKRVMYKWQEFFQYLDSGFLPKLMTELRAEIFSQLPGCAVGQQ